MQRTQQLRDLYNTLSTAGNGNQPPRKPSSLDPEDLTETEWFYLVCMSSSFASGSGLPGRAFAEGRYVWLCGTNEANTKVFNRSLLAKFVNSPTKPLMWVVGHVGNSKNGVCRLLAFRPLYASRYVKVFLSSVQTDLIKEDPTLVQHIRTFFVEQLTPGHSEHSVSSPQILDTSEHLRQHLGQPRGNEHPNSAVHGENQHDRDPVVPAFSDEANTEERGKNPNQAKFLSLKRPGEEAGPSLLEGRNNWAVLDTQRPLRQLITLGASPDPSQPWPITPDQREQDSQGAGLSNKVSTAHASRDMLMLGLRQPIEPSLHNGSQNTHYSGLQSSPTHLQHSGVTEEPLLSSAEKLERVTEEPEEAASLSAFVDWTNWSTPSQKGQPPENQQQMLKTALFQITRLYGTKAEDSKEAESSLATTDNERDSNRGVGGPRKAGGGAEELNGSHVLAERRRREKLNDRFMTLRALVPFVSKMDKASILGDAIDYVKDLQRRVQELETRNKQIQAMAPQLTKINNNPAMLEGKTKGPKSGNGDVAQTDSQPESQVSDKGQTDTIVTEQGKFGEPNTSQLSQSVKVERTPGVIDVQVSIEGDVVVLKLHCSWRKSLLLDILQTLNDLQLDVFVVQASMLDETLTASLKAKVKNNPAASIPTVMEVQGALRRIAEGLESVQARGSLPM